MKKMQKILCMLLALAMLLSFAACAAKEAAPSTTDTPAADAADAKTETKAEDTPAEQPAAELPELTLMLQTSDESNGLLAAVDYVNAHAEEIGAKLILESTPSTKNWSYKRHNGIKLRRRRGRARYPLLPACVLHQLPSVRRRQLC